MAVPDLARDNEEDDRYRDGSGRQLWRLQSQGLSLTMPAAMSKTSAYRERQGFPEKGSFWESPGPLGRRSYSGKPDRQMPL